MSKIKLKQTVMVRNNGKIEVGVVQSMRRSGTIVKYVVLLERGVQLSDITTDPENPTHIIVKNMTPINGNELKANIVAEKYTFPETEITETDFLHES